MNDFWEVRLFEDTQGSWFYWALICHRADFSHTVVIENACTLPSFLKAFSSGRNASPGFSGYNDCPYGLIKQVNTFGFCDLGQA